MRASELALSMLRGQECARFLTVRQADYLESLIRRELPRTAYDLAKNHYLPVVVNGREYGLWRNANRTGALLPLNGGDQPAAQPTTQEFRCWMISRRGGRRTYRLLTAQQIEDYREDFDVELIEGAE